METNLAYGFQIVVHLYLIILYGHKMSYPSTQYIKFLLKSTNQHGVHSPFVYSLVTQCFYNNTNYRAYKNIANYKKTLFHNRNLVLKNKQYPIAQTLKNAHLSYKRTKLLYRIANYFKFKSVLEVGTSSGFATQAIYLGNPKAHITTLETCATTSQFIRAHFKKNNLDHIDVITGNLDALATKLASQQFDFIFFNNNPYKNNILNVFKTLLQTAHNDSVFIITNIHANKGMREAWEIIKQHPKVKVTIDTFFWGFVFFRKEQAKEHFTIRV